MGYPIALAIGRQVLRPVAVGAFRQAATRFPVLTKFPQIPAPPSGLPQALVTVWAGAELYSWLRQYFGAGNGQWTVHCNTGPERDEMGIAAIATCDTLGFLSSPALVYSTSGPNETYNLNYGRDVGPVLPGFGVRTYSASLTRPIAGEPAPALPGSGVTWVDGGIGARLNPTTGRGKGYYGAVLDPWFPPVGLPFDRPIPYRLAPYAGDLAGQRAEGPTRGYSIPQGVPATGAVSVPWLERMYWQEAVDSAPWAGRPPAFPPAPVAPINPAFPPSETPFPAAPIPGTGAVPRPGLASQLAQSEAKIQKPTSKKEKKIASRTLGGLLKMSAIVWNHADDWKDYVEALHKALPKSCQRPAGGTSRNRGVTTTPYGRSTNGGVSYGRGNRRSRPATGRSVDTRTRVKPTPQVMIANIAKCFGSIDGKKAVANIAKEAMEDILGAGAAHLRDASAKKATALGGKPIFNTGRETRSPGISF